MKFSTVQRILGLLMMIFSTSMLPPILVGIIYQDGAILPFVFAFILVLSVGSAAWFPVRTLRTSMQMRDGFLIVVLLWIVLGISGAIPFLIAEETPLSFTDAFFESISGLTTTGATILTNYSSLPKSLLFYRQQLHWFGGMGIIVLAVAILPMLGVGAMQMFRAETTGPSKNKFTPRINETAKILWYIYLSLTAICTLAYWFAGMSFFDAICHSFSTISTGGFSNYESSLGHFQSPLIEWLAIFFMFMGGANFTLHFMAMRYRSIATYFKDSEFKAYLLLHLLFSLFIFATLLITKQYSSPLTALRDSLFQTVSVGTTTGFMTSGYSHWPTFIPIMLVFISFFGGCSGSTAGGIKTIRALILFKQGRREIQRVLHPNARILIKLDNKPVNERVIESVWGYFAIYVFLFVVMMLILLATQLDLLTAFSSVAMTFNTTGPGLGLTTSDFSQIPILAKWVSIFAMLLGRLEIFTLMVLLTPSFWTR